MLTQARHRRSHQGAGNTLARVLDSPITRLRSDLGDANIVAIYVMGYGQSATAGVIDSWADARGTAFGPTLTGAGAARPTVDSAGVVTFDGVDDYLRVSGAAFGITGACGLAMVGTLYAGGSSVYEASLSNAAVSLSLGVYTAAGPQTRVRSATDAILTTQTGVRVLHGRRIASGGNLVSGARFGSGTEATGTAAGAYDTPNRLTLGANMADVPVSFGAFSLRAFLVYKGDYASGTQYEAVNRFALTLGAAL